MRAASWERFKDSTTIMQLDLGGRKEGSFDDQCGRYSRYGLFVHIGSLCHLQSRRARVLGLARLFEMLIAAYALVYQIRGGSSLLESGNHR